MKASFRKMAALSLVGGVVACAVGARLRKRVSFRGCVAVITGGSRGLGLAMARELGREGARVHLLARDGAELDRAAQSLRELGAFVETWPCDVKEVHELQGAIHSVARSEGRIDLLINNAGIILVSPLEKLQVEDFSEAMKTHFWAPLHATRAALPYLKKSRGRIVNIASIGGRLAVPHLAAYSASKFALVGLSEALRSELDKDGVSVTTVSPGLMRTGSHVNAEFKGDHEKEYAWFSLGATLPFISIGAERAARQIIAATRARRAELTITVQARLAVVAQALMPGAVAGILALVNRVLPAARGGNEKRRGKQATSWISPSVLTILGDRAGRRLNEN